MHSAEAAGDHERLTDWEQRAEQAREWRHRRRMDWITAPLDGTKYPGWSKSLRRELLPDIWVTLIEPGAVATELPSHITHSDTKQGVEQLYSQVEVTAEDIAEVIAFVVGRPRRLAHPRGPPATSRSGRLTRDAGRRRGPRGQPLLLHGYWATSSSLLSCSFMSVNESTGCGPM
jgi:hypothetical protein